MSTQEVNHQNNGILIEDQNSPTEQTLTIADVIGIKVTPKKRQTCCGWARTWDSFKRSEKIYLICSLMCLIVSIGVTLERLIVLETDSDDFTFALLLLWTTLFCITYVLHGMLTESSYELMAFVLTTFIVLVYIVANFFSTLKTTTVIKITRLALTLAISPILIFYGYKFSRNYQISGKLLFSTAGAKLSDQSIFKLYFLCTNLLVFDLQFCGSALILWLQDGLTNWTTEEIVVISIGTVLTVLWTATALIAIRIESKFLVYLCYGFSPFEVIIIIWNLIRNTGKSGFSPQLTLSVWASAVIAILVRLSSVIILHFVANNFGKGIKDKLYGKPNLNAEKP